MRSRLPQLYAAVGATILLAGCIPDTFNVDVQVTAPEQEQGQPGDQAALTAPEGPACMKPLTVDVGSTDAHIKTKQRFRVVGPSAVGDYELRPLPSASAPPHSVLPGDYPLLVLSSSGMDFVTELSVQGDTHGTVTPHIYDVAMEFGTNGCPSKLSFEGQAHTTPGSDDDHAGHAVLN